MNIPLRQYGTDPKSTSKLTYSAQTLHVSSKRGKGSAATSHAKSKIDVRSPVHTPVILGEDDPLFLCPGILRTRPETTVILSVSLPVATTSTFDSTYGIPILSIQSQSCCCTTTGILHGRRVPTGGLRERQLTGMVPGVRTVS